MSSRVMYVSPQCVAQHTALWVFVATILASMGGKLALELHDDETEDTAAKLVKLKAKKKVIIAVVRQRELGDPVTPFGLHKP